jgi:hypothetical protein
MGKYYFQTPSPELGSIAKRLVVWFKQHEYDVDSTQDDQVHFIQAAKTGKLRTLTGTNIAFKITLSPSDTTDEFICDMTTGQWTANLAGAGMTALFTGGITLLTGAMGAAWTYKVERDVVEFMEKTLKFRKMRSDTIASPSSPETSVPPPLQAVTPPPMPHSPSEQAAAQVRLEIQKLEEAHRAGILTAEEVATKTREVTAKQLEYEIQIVVAEKTTKLQEAMDAEIISKDEYEKKVAGLVDSVRASMTQEKATAVRAERVAKLKDAREAGILSDDEYEAKVAALD